MPKLTTQSYILPSAVDRLSTTLTCLQSWQQSLAEAEADKREANTRYGRASANRNRRLQQESCEAGEMALQAVNHAQTKILQLSSRVRQLWPEVERELKAIDGTLSLEMVEEMTGTVSEVRQ